MTGGRKRGKEGLTGYNKGVRNIWNASRGREGNQNIAAGTFAARVNRCFGTEGLAQASKEDSQRKGWKEPETFFRRKEKSKHGMGKENS